MNLIGKKEFSSMLITLMSVKLLLSYPLNFIKNSGNAAWIQMIFVTLICLLIFKVTTMLYEKKINIIELAGIHGNKAVRITVGLLIFIALFLNMVSVMRIFPESVKIVLLPDVETDIIIGVCALTVFIGAILGIESSVRINYIFLSICGILLVAFLLLLLPYYKIENILPLLGNGGTNIFLKGINGLSVFSDIIVLNILLAYSKNIKEARDSGYRAIIISGTVGVLTTLIYGLIYPYPVSENFILPMYQITRMINLSSFFNRFEALFQFIWSILVFLYGTIYVYMLCFVWQTTFGLKYIRPLFLPVVLLVSAVALIPQSIMDANNMEKIFENISYPIAFLLPIIIGAIDKRKGIKENESS